MKEHKLYVLVRKDLPKAQQAVQAGHALAQFVMTHPDSGWSNGTLVYLEVEDLVDLEDNLSKARRTDHKFAKFHEPYRNMGLTACALYGEKIGEKLKDLTLLSL